MSWAMLIFGDFTHPPSAYVFVFSDYSVQLLNCYNDPDFKGKFPGEPKTFKTQRMQDREE